LQQTSAAASYSRASFARALPALIVSYSAGPGGAERILADHATALGEDTCVACPEGWLAGAVREHGLRVFPLRARPLELRTRPLAAAADLAGHAREVRALARNLCPRVVVAWGMRSLLACAAARLDPPLVFQHNDLLPGPAVGRAVRSAARRCELVIALSQTIADDLGVPGTRVIRPGVDLDRFRPGPEPGTPSALFLAALVPWKRAELAVEATRIAGVQLVIAGGGTHRPPPASHVTLAGRLDDPRPALHAASCLIHCADREPFGLALVEALACGVPVVAPAAGGPVEIVDDSCGRLFPPGDAGAAARALTDVLRERPAASAAARARAERHFDLRASRRAFADASGAPPAPRAGEGIGIVTVLHDSGPEVRRLMASIDRHLPGARLVAVDSGSATREGADAARAWGARVIELGENVGYGRATNAGLAALGEPVAVIANPDVELLDSSLAELAREAARAPDRILAPLVVQPDGGREPSAHAEPASGPELFAAVLPPTALPRRVRSVAQPSSAARPRRVAWAAGCCLVARTDTLLRLGPFDERTFLYAEDMDLGLRAADAGVETWFHPEARVLHDRAHSTGRAFGGEAFGLLARRRAEVVGELRGRRRARLDALVQAATFTNRIAIRTLLRRPAGRERAQLRAIRGRSAR
jgi:GT2 family glycosyltransferase/glycosyltransferase involved in cell wall biosynthesis